MTTTSRDIDALVRDILDNPEKLLSEELQADEVLELQKRLNPYAGIAAPPQNETKKRVAAVSYTNLREEYLRRFTMTSLVGFIHQVYGEWEVPAALLSWTPPAAEQLPPHEPAKLVEILEGSLAIAKEAHQASVDSASAKRQAAEAELTGDDTAAGLAATAEKEAARTAALTYVVTHALHRAGLDAGARLRAAAEAAIKFEEVRDTLKRYPLPAPAGQVSMPAEQAKHILGAFLADWFEFDPNVHVRGGHDSKLAEAARAVKTVGGAEVAVDTADGGHLPLEAVRAAAPKPSDEHAESVQTITSSPANYRAVSALLRDPDLARAAAGALADPEAFRHYLWPVAKDHPARGAADIIPPQDTFHRWSYYTEVNYDALRTITEAIYPERPDLDWAIAMWEVFEGTQAEVDAAFEQHCQRYQDEVPSAIKALEFGCWSLLADFKENREKIQFYNKHTEVLKRILDRHADDKRIGAELMRNRVRLSKAKNIATDGPDAPGLNSYRNNISATGRDLGARGAERVIPPEEMRRLERTRGDPKAAKELEVFEQCERSLAEYEERASQRALSLDEQRELVAVKARYNQAKEMLSVPEDTVQVDVFTSDPKTGAFTRSHFYTKAEAPDKPLINDSEPPPLSLSEHPATARPAQPAKEAQS